jgi:hypothetical protein
MGVFYTCFLNKGKNNKYLPLLKFQGLDLPLMFDHKFLGDKLKGGITVIALQTLTSPHPFYCFA